MDQNESMLLGRIMEAVDGLTARVDRLADNMETKLEDHEDRIRASEKWRNRAHGVLGVLTFSATALGVYSKWLP